MGYYIQVPKNKGKAQQLVELYGAEILSKPPTALEDIPKDKALICVVDNGPWEAAGFCYSQREFEAFNKPDTIRNTAIGQENIAIIDLNPTYQRPRIWLLMDLRLARKLTGYADIM